MRRASGNFPLALGLDRAGGLGMQHQIFFWFQRAIVTGTLRPGQFVPSSRALALELGISRTPVLNAYEQLASEGYLEPVRGAGTRVVATIPEDDVPPRPRTVRLPEPTPGPRRISRWAGQARGEDAQPWLRPRGPFRLHSPALAEFPVRLWAQLVARASARSSLASYDYGDSMGTLPFREALAEYLGASRAVRCHPTNIMVVSGSQQALALSARVLLQPGDRVWMEDPGYPGAHQALLAAGLRLCPVPVDHEGLIVEEGQRRYPSARAVYLTPSHQYPTGAVMSATRRLQLLQWAARFGAWVLEDDYDSEYRFGVPPIGALQGLDGDQRVIYIGTFSKVLFPALRVGYLVLPSDLASRFAAVRDAADIFPAPLYQAVLTAFLREGHFARHLRRMRLHYANLRAALIAQLEAQFAGRLQLLGAPAGMHVAGLLPAGISDHAVSAIALRRGLSVMPLSFCRLRSSLQNGLVLGYGSLRPDQIAPAAAALRACVDAVARARE